MQTAPGSEGTEEAGKFLAFGQIDDDWVIVGNESPGRTYRIMEVLGGSTPTYSLTLSDTENGIVSKAPNLEAYPAGTEITLTATPNEGFQFEQWVNDDQQITENPYTFAIESDTTFTAEFAETFQFEIPEIEGGTVTTVPADGPFPVGSIISISAEPEEGYEFVKWLYGDEELTGSPTNIVIKEGVTLTPVFAKIEEPEPLQIDIEQAVAVSWNSQSDTIYQIHRSSDMETWEVAIDNITGTGERMIQCFLRGETEVFYRVAESP